METLTAILVLAALGEALVEYLVKPLVDLARSQLPAAEDSPPPAAAEPQDTRGFILRYVAAGVGVLLAFAYQVDLLGLFGLVPPWPWIGYLVTGLVLGRGSSFVHDFAGRWLTPSR